MKYWLCEEVPALTVDGKVIDTMLLREKEIVKCEDCKHYKRDTCSAGAGMAFPPPADWYCADGERKEA